MFFLPPVDLKWPLSSVFGILSYFKTPNTEAGIKNARHLRKDRYQHPGLRHLTNHHRDLTTRVSLPHRQFPVYQYLTPPAHRNSTAYITSAPISASYHPFRYKMQATAFSKAIPIHPMIHRLETLDLSRHPRLKPTPLITAIVIYPRNP